MPRKVLSITGTRADYGLMRPVHRMINDDDRLDLTLMVTGMHFLPEFSQSLDNIRQEQLGRLIEVPVFDEASTSASMAITMAKQQIELTSVIKAVKPDLVLLQGDRGEMLAAAIAATHLNIPVVHMSGGDLSGTIDDSIRHAITKFAHIHLPTCEQSKNQLLAMNEEDQRICIVGEPALDIIRTFQSVPDDVLAQKYNIDFERPFVIATQHPVTTECDDAAEQIKITIDALESLGVQTIFTYPNSDAGGQAMRDVLNNYKDHKNIRVIPNLGQDDLFSLMKLATAMVGNSSSGILEAASFRLPVINIGTRQHGRLRANNVFDVDYNADEIVSVLQKIIENKAYKEELQDCVNPYGDGFTAQKTTDILCALRLEDGLLSKWVKGFNPFEGR